jgi:hypothetical protein
MALEQTELATYSADDIFAVFPQVSMNDHVTSIFGASAGAETLARCAPVGFNSTTGYYGAWVAPVPTVLHIEADGAITVDGTATAAVDVSADTPAIVEAKLLAIGVQSTVTEDTDVFTVTLDGATQVAIVPTVTVAGVGNTVTAGTSTYGLSTIVGFVWPDEIDLNATLQVQGEVMVKGRIAYSYIEDTVAAGDVTALQTELKNNAMSRGLIIEGLPNIH